MGRRGEKVKEGFTEEVKPGLGFVNGEEFARQVRRGPEEQHVQEPRAHTDALLGERQLVRLHWAGKCKLGQSSRHMLEKFSRVQHLYCPPVRWPLATGGSFKFSKVNPVPQSP